jgi:hypothetical protein
MMQIKNVSSFLMAKGSALVHLGLEATANTVNMVGKGILFAGSLGSAVLAYDTYSWAQGREPIWAKAFGAPAAPLVHAMNSYQFNMMRITFDQTVSMQALLVLGGISATVAGVYICSKVEALFNRINQL